MVLVVVLFMLNCTKNIAGSEVTNEKCVATIYLPNNKPAKNATVLIVPADYIPASGLSKSSATMLSDLRTSTDDQGHYSVNGLADGCYNVWAELDSLVMLHDSIYIASTSLLQSISDTLNLSASLSGVVKIQPNHNVATVIVQALGTNIYANVDSKGQFNLPRLAKGDYQLKFSTSISGYVPKFVSVGIRISKPDTIKDTIELTYTGIPVVTGIKASYDSSNGTVRIQWDTVNYSNLSDFVIYRAPFDTIQSAGVMIGATMNTFFVDSSIRYLDTGTYQFKYRVAILDNSISRGAFYKFADISFHCPGRLSVHIININDDWQDNIFLNGSAVVKAQIKSPLGPIVKVEWWRQSWSNNVDGWSFKDTLLQSNVFSKSLNFAIDSVLINISGHYSVYENLLCKATDIFGDTTYDTTNIQIYPDSKAYSWLRVHTVDFRDSMYVDSVTPIVATISYAPNDITLIQWKSFQNDSILKSVNINYNTVNYSDTLRFQSSLPGMNTIYCSVTDAQNQINLDSLQIWVMPK
jgi:hypothetical protein